MTRLDPARDRVALQVSDGDGALYCQILSLVATKRGLTRGVLFFSDRTGTRAAGLQRARLKIRSDGRAVFRAAGGKMELRTPADGGTRVTVHAGGQCLQADPLMRTKPAKAGTRNVYP